MSSLKQYFRRDLQTVRSDFSLLTLASSNCIRLYSFSSPTIAALRDLFTSVDALSGFREVTPNNFCEFSLDGKPWSNPKSIATERLLLEIFSIIYSHGYHALSTIDYGRESDDKLALVFSKPTPILSSSTDIHDSPIPYTATSSSGRPSTPQKRVPFALSFPSATLLRVINPPLHSTPAILQAVRGAWPRGVVSEKKVGTNSFEFKLKGYKWFQEDTFATDSLRHILGLLGGLDSHSFTLLTSLSLTSRSRVKDLWIFTGPAGSSDDGTVQGSPAPSILTAAAEIKRTVPHSPDMVAHRRLATEPAQGSPLPTPFHMRSASDSPRRQPVSIPPSPVRVAHPLPEQMVDSPSDLFHSDPSAVPASPPYATPDIFYATSPLGNPALQAAQPVALAVLNPSESPASSPSTRPQVFEGRNVSSGESTGPETPNELLGPTAFRDSAFSSATDLSTDIPIKWTGTGVELRPGARPHDSMGPLLPGGWQPTPIEEKAEINEIDLRLEHDTSLENPLQNVTERQNPGLNQADPTARKSEAALVEMAPEQPHADQMPLSPASEQGKGWVVVDVEGQEPSDDKIVSSPSNISENPPLSPVNPSDVSSPLSGTPGAASPNVSMSPAAKAIVIIDAVDAKKKSKSSDSFPKPKRWFSLSRKDKEVESDKAGSESDTQGRSGSKVGIQERLKRFRTPHATRNDKRRSIDG